MENAEQLKFDVMARVFWLINNEDDSLRERLGCGRPRARGSDREIDFPNFPERTGASVYSGEVAETVKTSALEFKNR